VAARPAETAETHAVESSILLQNPTSRDSPRWFAGSLNPKVEGSNRSRPIYECPGPYRSPSAYGALKSRGYLRPLLAARLRERSVFGDRDVRDRKAETRLSRRAGALLQSVGFVVAMSDNEGLVSGERAECILDCP
jgi:hypothetical protein